MTLIQEGRRLCDSRCYEASRGSECHCICEGRCHGLGLDLAQRRAEATEQEMRKRERIRKSAEQLEAEIERGQRYLFRGAK